MASTDVYWTIHTAQDTFTALAAINDPREINNVTRGERATFQLLFLEDDGEEWGSNWGQNWGGREEVLIIDSNETYTIATNETEIYSGVNIKENGTLNVKEGGTINLTGNDNRSRAQDYQLHAGSFSTQDTLDNTKLYREQIPSGADIESLVLGLEPSQRLQNFGIRGVWGLVTAGSDTREAALNNSEFELELWVLDEFPAYSDYTDVKNSLEV